MHVICVFVCDSTQLALNVQIPKRLQGSWEGEAIYIGMEQRDDRADTRSMRRIRMHITPFVHV